MDNSTIGKNFETPPPNFSPNIRSHTAKQAFTRIGSLNKEYGEKLSTISKAIRALVKETKAFSEEQPLTETQKGILKHLQEEQASLQSLSKKLRSELTDLGHTVKKYSSEVEKRSQKVLKLKENKTSALERIALLFKAGTSEEARLLIAQKHVSIIERINQNLKPRSQGIVSKIEHLNREAIRTKEAASARLSLAGEIREAKLETLEKYQFYRKKTAFFDKATNHELKEKLLYLKNTLSELDRQEKTLGKEPFDTNAHLAEDNEKRFLELKKKALSSLKEQAINYESEIKALLEGKVEKRGVLAKIGDYILGRRTESAPLELAERKVQEKSKRSPIEQINSPALQQALLRKPPPLPPRPGEANLYRLLNMPKEEWSQLKGEEKKSWIKNGLNETPLMLTPLTLSLNKLKEIEKNDPDFFQECLKDPQIKRTLNVISDFYIETLENFKKLDPDRQNEEIYNLRTAYTDSLKLSSFFEDEKTLKSLSTSQRNSMPLIEEHPILALADYKKNINEACSLATNTVTQVEKNVEFLERLLNAGILSDEEFDSAFHYLSLLKNHLIQAQNIKNQLLPLMEEFEDQKRGAKLAEALSSPIFYDYVESIEKLLLNSQSMEALIRNKGESIEQWYLSNKDQLKHLMNHPEEKVTNKLGEMIALPNERMGKYALLMKSLEKSSQKVTALNQNLEKLKEAKEILEQESKYLNQARAKGQSQLHLLKPLIKRNLSKGGEENAG